MSNGPRWLLEPKWLRTEHSEGERRGPVGPWWGEEEEDEEEEEVKEEEEEAPPPPPFPLP